MARGVFAIIDDLNAGLKELKTALEPLSALVSLGRNGSSVQAGRPRKARGRPAGPAKKIRRKASPKLRAFRAMQGKYLGALRNLTAGQRAQVKKAKASGGYEPALKLAAQLRK